MATTQTALTEEVRAYKAQDHPGPRRRIDAHFVLGLSVALGAVIAGISAAGISITYFFQPAGALIVIGGTLGVMLVTTPKASLVHSFRRVVDLISSEEVNREALIEEIIFYARVARRGRHRGRILRRHRSNPWACLGKRRLLRHRRQRRLPHRRHPAANPVIKSAMSPNREMNAEFFCALANVDVYSPVQIGGSYDL